MGWKGSGATHAPKSGPKVKGSVDASGEAIGDVRLQALHYRLSCGEEEEAM